VVGLRTLLRLSIRLVRLGLRRRALLVLLLCNLLRLEAPVRGCQQARRRQHGQSYGVVSDPYAGIPRGEAGIGEGRYNQKFTGENLDAVTHRLSHITAIRGSQLASKYADAVVHGYCRVSRQHMDIKTLAETLHDAKDALREFTKNPLHGSMKVYPVQMVPVDWFQSLSTSFTTED
jgi:hypothetical protein